MSDEKMRAEFEAWYGDRHDGFMPSSHDGEYDWYDCQACWEAWKASRAALEIELPSSESMQACPSTSSAFDAAYSVAVKHCRAAIEAVGVRVKP